MTVTKAPDEDGIQSIGGRSVFSEMEEVSESQSDVARRNTGIVEVL